MLLFTIFMKGVEIVYPDLLKEDERGSIYESISGLKMVLVKSKKGAKRASCYHTGKNPFKFPKKVLIAFGKVEAYFKNVKTGEELREVYDKPVLFMIQPYVFHEFVGVTDNLIIDLFPAGYYDDKVK